MDELSRFRTSRFGVAGDFQIAVHDSFCRRLDQQICGYLRRPPPSVSIPPVAILAAAGRAPFTVRLNHCTRSKRRYTALAQWVRPLEAQTL